MPGTIARKYLVISASPLVSFLLAMTDVERVEIGGCPGVAALLRFPGTLLLHARMVNISDLVVVLGGGWHTNQCFFSGLICSLFAELLGSSRPLDRIWGGTFVWCFNPSPQQTLT